MPVTPFSPEEPPLTSEVGQAAGQYAVAIALRSDAISVVESAELADLPLSLRAELLATAAEALIRHIRELRDAQPEAEVA
jgi:hypothetical protein